MPVCKHTDGDGNFASPACLVELDQLDGGSGQRGRKLRDRRSGKEFGHLIYLQKMKGFPKIQCGVTTFLELFTLEMRKKNKSR
ncbi:hypothetical protein EYF80_019504 [Liparis tanakae]|uniref:Uncharacterized protein n=1 Tax=Liparis tanakae TaxID=230148 RepID=A0A4Z2HXN3_9TELE|nr:hypothetical protein EYF80_019504 [Liparis tanakae]